MEQLDGLVSSESWLEAGALASQLQLDPDYIPKLQLTHSINNSSPISASTLSDLLTTITPTDPLWSAQAALQLTHQATSLRTAEAAVELGLDASLKAAATSEQLKLVLNPRTGHASTPSLDAGVGVYSPALGRPPQSVGELAEEDRTVVEVRKELLEVGDGLASYKAAYGDDEAPEARAHAKHASAGAAEGEEDDEGADWDLEEEGLGDEHTVADDGRPLLAEWITSDLVSLGIELAATGAVAALLALCSHHADKLWPHRLVILDALPEWTSPEEYLPLLPTLNTTGTEEARWPQSVSRAKDWSERLIAADGQLNQPAQDDAGTGPLSPHALADHFTARIERTADLGLIGIALSLAQHLASRGLPGVDALGEELSLLSRLVYDRTQPAEPQPSDTFTLERWRSLQPADVVQAYVAHAGTATLADDLRTLVLPYLSVLESHLDRAGKPDPQLPTRMLADFILSLAESTSPADLDRLAAVFEASTPALPAGRRLVRDDAELARLAVACSYGCPAKGGDALAALSRIFECLPALGGTPQLDGAKSIYSLWPADATPAPTSHSLHTQLATFPPAALAAALDLLDLHLSTAEIFARYSCPVPLGFMLSSHDDARAQQAWATRMARTAADGGVGGDGEGGEFESEDEWVMMLEQFITWTEGEGETGKVFWKLGRDEVARIFFGGLLGAGKFNLARSLLQPSSGSVAAPLEPSAVEELVLAASRELYDNAESGNLHSGDMKLAFDCLSAAPQTPAIRKERDFIEATSRLASFRLTSQPGVPLAPIEIRLSTDRLSFVSRLLGANEDAYRHPDVILELVSKLGYGPGGVAGVRAQAMIADAALQAGDSVRAAETVDKVVEEANKLIKSKAVGEEDKTTAREVGWQACYALGRNPDVSRAVRMRALGLGMGLCPPERIASLLADWTALEATAAAPDPAVSSRAAPSVTEAASRQLGRAAAFLPFGGGQSHVPPPPRASGVGAGGARAGMQGTQGGGPGRGDGRAMPSTVERAGRAFEPLTAHLAGREGGLRDGLSKGLTAGVGWLIGANPDEL